MLECRVVVDKYTLKSRGFGFVTYADMKVTEKVLGLNLKLFGKDIECKSALSKTQSKIHINDEKSRKLFIGGLPSDLEDKELYDYFKQFGEIKQSRIIREEDCVTSRGFGFIIFKQNTSIDKVLNHTDQHFIKGKWIDCKPALLRDEIPKELAKNHNSDQRKKRNHRGSKKIVEAASQNFKNRKQQGKVENRAG